MAMDDAGHESDPTRGAGCWSATSAWTYVDDDASVTVAWQQLTPRPAGGPGPLPGLRTSGRGGPEVGGRGVVAGPAGLWRRRVPAGRTDASMGPPSAGPFLCG